MLGPRSAILANVRPVRTSAGRYLTLDVWRGLACLSVLVYHASGRQPDAGTIWQELIARLWIGVPVFFVISGYCITASITRTERTAAALRHYFARRLRRIFPPYWAMLALVAGLAALLGAFGHGDVLSHTHDGFAAITHPRTLTAWQWLGTVTLTEGWRDHVLPFPGRWYLGHAWTLGFEEQFYIVCGLLLIATRRWWFAAAAATTLAVVALVALAPRELLSGFWFNGRWLMFASGIGVYYQTQHAEGIRRLVVPAALAAAVAWAVTQPSIGSEGLPTEVAVGAVLAAVLIALYRHDTRLATLRILQPFAWCGLRCYSLYLLHWPIAKMVLWGVWMVGIRQPAAVVATAVPLTLAIALPVAAIFFHYVERPCLSTAARRASGTSTPSSRGAAGDDLAGDVAASRSPAPA